MYEDVLWFICRDTSLPTSNRKLRAAVEMAETEEKEEINYASVVFKNKNHPPPQVKKEDEIVYDEVKTQDKTAEQTGDTNGIQKANSGRHDRQWACCLGILCILLLSGLITLVVILTLSHNELNQLKENQTSLLADKNNLTKLNHKLSSDNQNLTRERDNLTDQFNNLTKLNRKLSSDNQNLTRERNNLTQACAVLESNVTNLMSQNQQLKTQITNLTSQNREVGTQNQQLTEEKKNLTARIQDMETQWNEQNISRAQWSVDLYCPITNGERKCKPCLDKWTSKPPNCYAINDAPPADQRTWDRAREDCKGKNSDLAVIANEQEKTSVGDALFGGVQNNEFWIGLRAEDGKWKWLDGSELTDNSWIQQPPADGQCALFHKDNKWRSANCNNKHQWICQQKALTLKL